MPVARPHRWIAAAFVLALAVLPAAAQPAWPRIELERPVHLTVRTVDDESFAGQLVAYDGQALELRSPDDQVTRVTWAKVPTRRAYAILSKLLESRDAQAWLGLGQLMLAREDGEPFADRAFARAVHLDEAVQPRVDAIRRGDSVGEDAVAQDASAEASMGGAPRTVGPVQADFWGALTDEQHAAAVDQLNDFAARGAQAIGADMRLIETKYFLFYSDLRPGEAQKWAGLLDKMYDRLCDLFGIERGVNIWRGKCLIFVFANEADFHRFEAGVHGAPSEGLAAGRCWSYGNGAVHVTFFRQPQESVFAHVLVHEAVHGFLHRYRSPVPIPSAWNEGLAEVIAMELVPQSGIVPRSQMAAAMELKRRGGLGPFFDTDHIEDWHYGIASHLTEMMIRENKRGYVAFINGIKDGAPWRESLEKNYGVNLDRLVAYFGDKLGVRGLRP